MKIPIELERWIQEQPPATQNNARSILRSDINKAMSMNPISGANYLNGKYNIGLDPDRTAEDYGGAPQHDEEHYN